MPWVKKVCTETFIEHKPNKQVMHFIFVVLQYVLHNSWHKLNNIYLINIKGNITLNPY